MKFLKDDKREQRRLEKLLRKTERHNHVAVGILQDEDHDGFSMIDLAMVHEYGSDNGHIPERSFIRSTCDAKRKEHLGLIQKFQWQILLGRMTAKEALTQLGEVVSKDMVQTINNGIEPGLADSTLQAKKGSLEKQNKKLRGDGFTPLIETGRLKGSITHEIRGGA